MKTYILDTNIILDNIDNIFKLYNNENRIVISDTVIDEIDTKKTSLDEIGYRAREFARFLDSLKIKEIKNDSLYTITYLESDQIKLEIISKDIYKSDEKYANSKEIQNDRRIIEICHYYHNDNPVFVSMDTMCRIRATSEGFEAQTLGNKEIEKEFEFIKNIEFDFAYENMDIYDLDPNHKQENYNYFIKQSDGKCLLGRCVNKRLKLINEENLNKQDIRPLNIGQKFYVDNILDDMIDVVIVNSAAGTGKSLLALASAMRLINEKKFNKIVYIRNSIESLDKGEDVGYLSGNDEKFAVYNHPLHDSIALIAKTQLEKSNKNKSNAKKSDISLQDIEERSAEIFKKYNIEAMWIGELRGRTISDAIVIIDEFQNMSRKSALTTFSRIDKNCKVIVTGSNRQIDNPYINKYVNGLTTLLNAATLENSEINLGAVKLDKVVRGPITEFAERVFEI